MVSKDFLTSIIGYIVPFGSLQDPIGKEGLANILVDSYSYGKRGGVDVEKLFEKLESLGGTFNAEAGDEVCYLYVRAPKENIDECKDILDEMITNVVISEEELTNIKETLKKKILEVESDDRSYAKEKFFEVSLGKRSSLGTIGSLDSISIEDIERKLLDAASSKLFYKFSSPVNFQMDVGIKGLLKNSTNIYIPEDNACYLDTQFEQKVVMFGFSTGGYKDHEFISRQICTAIMSSGLVGLVPEEIREKHSAAYYASYSHKLFTDRGVAYMFAGVSDGNIVRTVSLMDKIFMSVRKLVDKERLEIAKSYSIGTLARGFDSIEAIMSLQLHFAMNDLPTMNYDEAIEKIALVDMNMVMDQFDDIVTGTRSITVNGIVDADIKDELNGYLK